MDLPTYLKQLIYCQVPLCWDPPFMYQPALEGREETLGKEEKGVYNVSKNYFPTNIALLFPSFQPKVILTFKAGFNFKAI